MSDIFDEYAKIAIEQGLIKKAEDVTKQTNPRFDSLDLEAIEMLYGVKPNGKDDDIHIVEQAHLKSVVVSPSYDRVNGLVENILERQDIMHFIATKPTHGKLIQERYVKAHQELLDEVIKVAFILDRDDEQNLMSFADNCAERLTKKGFVFTASTVLIALKIGAVALAATGLINNFGGMMDAGFVDNASRAVEELTDLVNDNELPGEQQSLQELIELIKIVKQQYQDLNSFSITGSTEEEVKAELGIGKKILIQYVKDAKKLASQITVFLRVIESSGKTEESWMSKNLGDAGLAVEKVFESIWSDDKRDALTILDTLKESLLNSVSNMQKYFSALKAKAETMNVEELTESLTEKTESEFSESTLSDLEL